MTDSEYSTDEEQSYDQQIKNLAKKEAINIFTKINEAFENIKKEKTNINIIIVGILTISMGFKQFQNMAVKITEYVFRHEPIVCELYHTFCIRIANKEIKPYICMSKECEIKAHLIRDELNF
jgi:uncharacterized BrkB/YihY/UPF0761 family membrane protein